MELSFCKVHNELTSIINGFYYSTCLLITRIMLYKCDNTMRIKYLDQAKENYLLLKRIFGEDKAVKGIASAFNGLNHKFDHDEIVKTLQNIID